MPTYHFDARVIVTPPERARLAKAERLKQHHSPNTLLHSTSVKRANCIGLSKRSMCFVNKTPLVVSTQTIFTIPLLRFLDCIL